MAHLRVFGLPLQVVVALLAFGLSPAVADKLPLHPASLGEAEHVIRSVATKPQPKRVVVFLPGILGSKLTDVATGRVIWGDSKFDDDLLAFDPTRATKASELPAVRIASFDWAQINVYRAAFKQIQELQFLGYDPLQTFSYDWRQSNEKSANSFFSYICGREDFLRDKSIVFLAHSMGGLILKEFFRAYYDPDIKCANGHGLKSFVSVDELMFVGTPHLGAPMALNSIAKVYELVTNRLINGWVAAGLNRFGIWFEAPYELLPIEGAPDCALAGADNEVISVQTDANSHVPIDIFAADTWRRLGMPGRADLTGADADKYYAFLDGRLKAAKQFLCRLAQYRFSPEIAPRVDYFAGRGKSEDTPAKIVIDVRNGGTQIRTENDFGDGTVPERSIAEGPIGGDPRHLRICFAEDHGHLLEDPTVVQFLVGIFRQAQYAQLDDIVTDPVRFGTLRSAFSSAGLFMPATIDGLTFTTDGKISGTSSPAVRQLNSWVLDASRLQTTDLYKYAKVAAAPDLRASYYALALTAGDIDVVQGGWLANNLGHLALQSGDATTAKTVFDAAVDLSNDNSVATKWQDQGLLAKVYGNSAAANFAFGDYAAAQDLAGRGAELGNPQSRILLETIKRVKE
jgi:hypothetical protein